ncbi:uncharacterized protein L969DRAFT_96928 [Mixia osmundae IAM 14324]|uniref:DUF7727 domain-containing protein n=1 Tax=Mixia osmundae (strain CBS 9802 / IAM 14324 / JCM 22182 / KY 12970) TaxID=764103 RepID=G7E2I1_MIXOS|nr:uncharacterized protein L969DRAFT_96928 [Mixia osmundae IAM 14324]KEI36913.1 hypothetical protein L969DRAFT_96928 [Mixia osmundae IAM 14324]GAA97041.1 hypothetical protein E5Q_03716 [Mixia osmundae IAM 14324]
MGNLIWAQWARLLALASATNLLWAASWAIAYRKFFWDMIDAPLGPHGDQPPERDAVFLTLIVRVPAIQIILIVHALIMLAFEWPLPLLRQSALYRHHSVKITFYVVTAVLASLVYQSIDGAFYLLIAAAVRARASRLREPMFPAPREAPKGIV